MSLFRKLVLFLLAATLVPIGALGLGLLRAAEGALDVRIRAAQREAVQADAAAMAALIEDRVYDLGRASSFFRLEGASPEELQGAARVVYRASPDVAATLIVDDRGIDLAPPVHILDPGSVPELADHPPASDAVVRRLRATAPLSRAANEGAGALVLSAPYYVPERKESALAVAMPVAGPDGRLITIAAEVSLRGVQRRVLAASALGKLTVSDAANVAVAHPDAERIGKPMSATGDDVLAHTAPVPVPGLDWTVRAELPADEAFRDVRRLRGTVYGATGAALLLLLLLGSLFIRGVQRALRNVVEGARAFGRGELEHRIDPPSERELRELANTFNAMGDELSAARTRLQRWNVELEGQVEERTRELKEAQVSLVQTQKLAAIGQLGAGVAHEINNPLSTIIGFAQLLVGKMKKRGAEDDDAELRLLSKLESSAQRCKEITSTLLRFSQQTQGLNLAAVDLGKVLDDVITMNHSSLTEPNVILQQHRAEGLPTVRADPGQLAQVMLHLLTNARTAVEGVDAPQIDVTLAAQEDGVSLVVADNGKGMDDDAQDRAFEPFFTTKDVWSNLGLGLSVTFRIVEDHGGHIDIESTPGAGTRVAVWLPTAGGTRGETLPEQTADRAESTDDPAQ